MSLLDQQIAEVAKRYRRLEFWRNISVYIGCLAVAGVALLLFQVTATWMHPRSGTWMLIAGFAGLLVSVVVAFNRHRDQRNVAERIERRYPELDHRLITTLEEIERNQGKPLGYLQHSVFQETLTHSYHNPWSMVVSPRVMSMYRSRGLAAICMVMACSVGLMRLVPPPEDFVVAATEESAEELEKKADFEIEVEPGNAELEQGSNLIVIARFGKQIPKEAMIVTTSLGEELRVPMSRSLDDPLFGGTVSEVQNDLEYRIEYGKQQSESYRITVFTYPALVRSDALLEYPSFTGLPNKRIEDTRRVSVVEGTRVTWNLHLNKPGIKAELIPAEATADPIPLQVDPTDPLNHLASLELTESATWKLRLTDADGRENRIQPTLRAKVTPNRPPNMKMELARDASVSPLEEFLVKATVSDDYGLKRYGLSYTLATETEDVVLGAEAPRREKKPAEHVLDFEALNAEPDQLLSYYFWAEDTDGQGNVRRTLSDMYFAEVRHFEEIFRQGEQQAGGQQQQQQQQGQQGQSQNEADAEQLGELQKQIVNATWNLIRRETNAQLSPAFDDDVTVLVESQQAASTQLQQLSQQLQDEESKRHAVEVQKHMQTSLQELMTAFSDSSVAPLPAALTAQRNAYEGLLKLRAREHEVQQQQQQPGQQSQSASRQRMQRQMQQLQLKNDQNRYETERQAQEQEDQAETEMRQALSRLRELAQRQQDLNEQLQELQNALEQAESEAEREEIERQLKRLRDQQQELLRDTDELMERLDESQDKQEALQETQEQLEQTREDIREAAESLERGEVTPALASGTRAQRDLEEMKEELRRESANQFSEQMREMRERARELETRQEEIAQQMEQTGEQTGGSGLRQQQPESADPGVADALREQNFKLNELLSEIEQTVREAEETEPLLAENLYEAFRDVEQGDVKQELERAAELAERGMTEPARELESDAREGIGAFRESIERAAESVLGDETDALRTAERMLQDLERQLDNEINQFSEPQEGQQRDGDSQDGNRSGQQPDGDRSETGEGQREDGERSPAESNDRERQQRDSQEEREGQPGQGQQGQQGESQESQRGENQDAREGQQGGGERQDQNQDSEQSQSESSGQQEGQQEGQQSGEQQGEGQQSGRGGGQSQNEQDSQQDDADRQGQPQQGQPQEGQQGGGQRRPRSLSQSLRGGSQQRQDGGGFGGTWEQLDMAPITGEDFRQWSDRLRDVEEIVDDPELRAEAARIREQARSFRSEFKRHSEEPKWELIRELVSRPLSELRQEVSAELLRRSAAKNALVPIDRDPVPEEFTEQVRRYYENLGRGE